MQGLLTLECLYDSLAMPGVTNSSIALPKYIGKLKVVTLKQAHIAQAYTEASTDSFATPRLKSHHCKVLQLYNLTCSLRYLPFVDGTLVTSPLYLSLTISVNTLGGNLLGMLSDLLCGHPRPAFTSLVRPVYIRIDYRT